MRSSTPSTIDFCFAENGLTAYRDAILADAVKLAKPVNYRNAGTAGFLMEQQNRYHFIEINPRIQVEHTITEEIISIDIVAAQLQIAAGTSLEQLGLAQDHISTRGGEQLQDNSFIERFQLMESCVRAATRPRTGDRMGHAPDH